MDCNQYSSGFFSVCRWVLLVLAGHIFIGTPIVYADEWGDLIDDFDSSDSADQYLDPDAIADPDKQWQLTTTVVLSSSWNVHNHDSVTGTDYGGLSQLRTELKERLDYKINDKWKARVAGRVYYDWMYMIRDRDDYTDQVLDSMEWEAEFEEVWVAGQLTDNVDIKLGRQIVNWGRSETIRILDVLNPVDNREIGMADIDDVRLPVTMVKTDIYDNHWTYSLIAIPETRFSKNPPFGNDFSTVDISDVSEPSDISGTSWAASAAALYEGWDISFHAARYWRDVPYLDAVYNGANPIASRFDGSEAKHDRMTTVGLGANLTHNAYLFKTEAAVHRGIKYTTSETVTLTPAEQALLAQYVPPSYSSLFPTILTAITSQVPSGSVAKDRVDAMLGVEYYGIADTTLTAEVAIRHIIGFQPNMKLADGEPDRVETSLRYTRNLMNDQLQLMTAVVMWGAMGDDGAMVRLSGEYELSNDLIVDGGFMYYKKGNVSPFNYIHENDRLFVRVQYSF